MAKNRASGNARVGVQAGEIRGTVSVKGGEVQVNGFTKNAAGTWTRNGVSVGIPNVNPCGCYGAETYSQTRNGRQCVRCGTKY